MIKCNKFLWFLASLFLMLNIAQANQVEILAADFHKSSKTNWSVSVTLQHDDKGWDHYADNWRVVNEKGTVLGNRILHHPHVNEQPFTRSLGGVSIPSGTNIVYIEAHDKVHGWTSNRLKIDLNKVSKGRLKVEKK